MGPMRSLAGLRVDPNIFKDITSIMVDREQFPTPFR